jgi:hypothetical protein
VTRREFNKVISLVMTWQFLMTGSVCGLRGITCNKLFLGLVFIMFYDWFFYKSGQ